MEGIEMNELTLLALIIVSEIYQGCFFMLVIARLSFGGHR